MKQKATIFFSILLITVLAALIGCSDRPNMNMMTKVIDDTDGEEAPTVPTVMMGEMKTEQPIDTDTDTTHPTVIEVGWYRNWQLTQPVIDVIRPGDTLYTKVVFSERMQHVVDNGESARPVFYIRVGERPLQRYRMQAHWASGETFQSLDAKPLHGGINDYICKYRVPRNAMGTVVLRVGGGTANTTGQRVAAATEHPAPFPVSTLMLPPGYVLPPELIPPIEMTPSENERRLTEASEAIQQVFPGFDPTAPNLQTQAGKTADLISLLPYAQREEVYDQFAAAAAVDLPFFIKAAQQLKRFHISMATRYGEAIRTGDYGPYETAMTEGNIELGITAYGGITLASIYFEENPADAAYRDGHATYWMLLEWYRLQLEHPELKVPTPTPEPAGELLDLFRASAKAGNIFGLDNPWE
jgi:hypothetical protein